jgi:hypothetical protein
MKVQYEVTCRTIIGITFLQFLDLWDLQSQNFCIVSMFDPHLNALSPSSHFLLNLSRLT